jgi:putative ABC transport system permease protein
MGQFLTLVGLASLVIAGIGVGNGVASYLEGKRAGIATLKVLGADSAAIFRIYVVQILAVALAAIMLGLIIGAVAPFAITALAGDVLPIQPGFAIHPMPLATSAAFGLLITLAFALPPLARTRHVPAAGLLRAVFDRAARIDVPTAAAVTAAVAAIVAIAAMTAREPLFSLGFMAAAAGLLLLLALIAWGIRRVAAWLPRPRAPLLRLAVTNLHRPGAQTGALVVALGLGLTLFVTMATIQTSLTAEIRSTVPQRAPSFFVLDIPQTEKDRFTSLVKGTAPDATINMIPALRGSVVAFGGQRVADLKELPEGAWVLRGDRGLTYSAALPRGSTVTAGTWWPKDYRGPPLVSLEEEVAASLGLGVGDTIAVNVLGVEVEARIASLRRVEWDNFGLNYVIVFAPGAIDQAPHNMVATLTVPRAAEAPLARAIPPAFPSSSMLEVRDVVSQITTLLTQMAQAIAAAASIAILAGIAVLIGAIAASRARRIYDSVILKLLGSTRAQILGAQAIEYALLSLVLALLALGLGLGAGWFVITQIFDFSFVPDYAVVLATLVGGAAITFLFGMASSLPILAAKPAAALRSL